MAMMISLRSVSPSTDVGEGPFIDRWVFGPDAVAQRPVGVGSKVEVHDATPYNVGVENSNVNDYNPNGTEVSTAG